MTDVEVYEAAADAAGLRYVADHLDGIRRRKRGKGFSYHLPDGTPIRDAAERARIQALAIPPAWTDVWICPAPDGHILATGRDDRGRKQYRYHPEWERVRSEDKFGSLPAFAEALPCLRERVDADLRKRNLPREKVLALVVRLLDRSLIRVGNEAYATENESYGLTTMLADHVEVDGPCIAFAFTAKGGLARSVYVQDQRLASIVRDCSELQGQDLFTYEAEHGIADVTSTDVNAYLRETIGAGVTAKHFRTWGGTVSAAAALAISRPPENDSQADTAILAAFDVAAEVLGNTRAVCRQSYVHPAVPEAYRSGLLAERWPHTRDTRHLRREERLVQRLLED
ncbi:MAG: putative topoisomerase [Acidimicrobiales bacterium]|nr:putative topoisomerase [Acidimicrobiales bacterium]